jgi:valyl-tRNA synthetase
MHPITPFVTEALWLLIEENSNSSIMYSKWPSTIELSSVILNDASAVVQKLQDLIRVIRNTKAEFHLSKPSGIRICVQTKDDSFKGIIENNIPIITDLAKVEEIFYEKHPTSSFIATVVDSSTTVFFSKDLLDIASEIQPKKQRIQKIDKELEKLQQKLSNENFMKHASEDLIQEVQSNFEEFSQQKQAILQRIEDLLGK